ncbi:longitudinals lacking protein, isoforms A/B/D/L-like isoform X2 [Leptinotarsa decemlineata]|uniref:longitudinals lacking protein, isoforms A/B/D/L-like isoform X2 n=1 Tax=Leptinotarsa decemlineata TaxID=7539 RepID=UPI003D304EEF
MWRLGVDRVNPYKCEVCQRDYKHRSSLLHHKRYECQNPPRFGCSVDGCLYRSKVKSNKFMCQ